MTTEQENAMNANSVSDYSEATSANIDGYVLANSVREFFQMHAKDKEMATVGLDTAEIIERMTYGSLGGAGKIGGSHPRPADWCEAIHQVLGDKVAGSDLAEIERRANARRELAGRSPTSAKQRLIDRLEGIGKELHCVIDEFRTHDDR